MNRRQFLAAATIAPLAPVPSSPVVSDFVFLEGMHPDAGESPMFYGVDRSKDSPTLRGCQVPRHYSSRMNDDGSITVWAWPSGGSGVIRVAKD
jgi:hypothetical protein